jgi:hypothetical protein
VAQKQKREKDGKEKDEERGKQKQITRTEEKAHKPERCSCCAISV